jgi:HrpA-like RNA helicase
MSLCSCSIITCESAHQFAVCMNGTSCALYECNLRHSKNRTRKCSRVECKGAGCSFLHRSQVLGIVPGKAPAKVGGTQYCEKRERCISAECRGRHPISRIAVCALRERCDVPYCPLLHPATPLDRFLASPADIPKFQSLSSRILGVRFSHQRKVFFINGEIRALEARVKVSDKDKASEDALLMKEKTRSELIGQRDAIDAALWSALQPLLSTLAGADVPTTGENLQKITKTLSYRIDRELYRLKGALPALALRKDIEDALQHQSFLVVQGATGSGKSTQLPAYFAEMPLFAGKKIICTQPRKLAATSLAMRVAEEWAAGSNNEKVKQVGGTVGYRVGAVHKTRPFTQIEYWTEGTFMTHLLSGRIDMSKVGAVVLDEAHERSIALDVVVGVLKSRHTELWPHLKVVVTSATLDTALFSAYFDHCPIMSIPGRMYSVDIIYRPVQDDVEKIVTNIVQVAWEIHTGTRVTEGDILCFLTGQDEVEKAVAQFNTLLRLRGDVDSARVFALYGKQLPEEQEGVFKPLGANTRKVVFSTDVAETSITINGICFVVDSGLTKDSVYDVRRNVTVLEVRAISKSSADQRKGRAGRTRPGTCYRLYSKDEYDGMRISQVRFCCTFMPRKP